MIEIKDLLAKFDHILFSGESKSEVVRKIIGEVTGISITKEQISIKNNIIYLDIKPIYKSEIFLKMNKIQGRLEESFGERSPQSIR